MNNNSRERYFELSLLFLILILGYALILQALPFVNGILGSITLYVLLRRPNFYLARKYGKRKSPWIITIAVTVFILIPLSLLAWYAIELVQNFDLDPKIAIEKITTTIKKIEEATGFDLITDKSLSFITAQFSNIFNMLMSGINNFAINVFTAILLLFFLLSGGMKMELYIAKLLPFSEENKHAVIKRLHVIVRSNAIGIPLLAVIQGVVATIGYMLCGVNNALLFGVLTGFASIIPIVGTMIVWIPLVIGQYFDGSLLSTLGLAFYCIAIISQCDNVIRMILQKRMANTHPLITIFGVIAGLPIFGFMGVIFGPLIVSMFLLFVDMFAKQYILVEAYTPQQSLPIKPENQISSENKEQ